METIWIGIPEAGPIWDFKKEESYPYLPIEVSKEDLTFIEKAFEDHDKAQDILTDLWDKQHKDEIPGG